LPGWPSLAVAALKLSISEKRNSSRRVPKAEVVGQYPRLAETAPGKFQVKDTVIVKEFGHMRNVFRSAAIALVLSLSLIPATAGTASASSAGSESSAACPQQGQRVQPAGSSFVYLIDGEPTARWITSDSYNNLWDSYAGIIPFTGSLNNCYPSGPFLANAHLVRGAGDARVWIWDQGVNAGHGAYRHIANPEVWAKYGFSSSKINVVDIRLIYPTGAAWI
jgi:hypothetical protein